MKKRRLVSLLAIAAFSLTGCALFDDSDIALSNHFNTPEDTPIEPGPDAVVVNGVEGTETPNAPDSLCFKNVSYASEDNSIKNTYALGQANHHEINVNNNEDYYATGSSNNYDIYVPKSALEKKDQDQIVILFVHGGAWVAGFKTDVNPYVHEFANKGYITATIKYTLLKREILKDDAVDDGKTNTPLSIFRDLDEIDACISSIKSVLKELGFNENKLKLVIGGASSGSHLAMLYSYSRGQNSAIPIQFIVDAVGPTDIKSYAWKEFINGSDTVLSNGLHRQAIESQPANLRELPVSGESFRWNEYQTMRIANGMSGVPYTITEAKNASTDQENIDTPNSASILMTMPDGGEDQLSVTYWLNKGLNTFPIICAYAGKDTVVGINQYATLQTALDSLNIQYGYTYFQNSKHEEITSEFDEVKYNQLVGQIHTWCSNILNNEPLAVLPHQ